MSTNFVQIFKSTDLNAPVLTGTAGSLIALLNTCLINGYTTASISSLTQLSSTVTATISTNSTLTTGTYVTISGAVPADYNGTFQITVLSNTQFTYTIATNPSSPATGTPVYAKSGIQWTSPYSATNQAVYRSADGSSNQFYLQINETGSSAGGQKEVVATGFETMTGVGSGTGQFPTTIQLASGGVIWTKSITADSTARAWTVIGDDKTFYLQIANGTWSFLYGFGHVIPNRPGDGYNTFIGGQRTANTVAPAECTFSNIMNMVTLGVASGICMPRSYTQVGNSCYMGHLTYTNITSTGNTYGVWNSGLSPYSTTWGPPFPNPADQSYIFFPTFLIEQTTYTIRARMPGIHHLWCSTLPFNNYDTVPAVNGLPSTSSLVALEVDGYDQNYGTMKSGRLLIDYVGPWI